VSTHPTPSGRRTAAAVAVLVIALAVAFPVLLTAIGARQKPGSDPKAIPVADALAELARSFSLQVVTKDAHFPVATTHGVIDGKAADARVLAPYVAMLTAEFGLYPPSLVRRMRLERVVIAVDLRFAGMARGAVPDFEHATLYLDAACGAECGLYQRKVLHHEFFHYLDWVDDWQLYEDPQWLALNPRDYHYGNGGINAQNVPTSSLLTDQYPGFLDYYSTTGVEEDKAEVFANLIVERERVDERVKHDAVLEAKVQRMRDLTKAFCADLGNEFWDRARRLPRPGN
jgi:hypothetical protein